MASSVTTCISTSAFASLLGILIGVANSAIGLKICATAAGIKKYKSIIKKTKNMLDEIVLIAKSKLNSIEVLIYKALIDSKISHDKFISINNVLKDCDDMKKETKTLRT